MRSFPGHFILQAEQPQFSQLFSLWGSFVLLILGSTSGLASSGPCISCAEGSSIRHSTADGISPEESRAEEKTHLPQPAAHSAGDAAQVDFLGFWCTLLAHVQFSIHQHTQELLCRAALNLFLLQPVFIPEAWTKCRPHHAVHMGPLLEVLQVHLSGGLNLSLSLSIWICVRIRGMHTLSGLCNSC